MSKKKSTATATEIDQAEKKIDVQAATLVGTVRDDILSIFKNHGEWKKLPEAKQRNLAEGAESIAKDLVHRCAGIIAARGFKAVHGQLVSVNVKDGLKMTITASKNVECRQELIDQQGGAITLVLSDTTEYVTERSEPEIDLDEPTLPLDGEKPKARSRKRK